MARSYKRDSRGRFSSTGGGRSARPAARPVSRGTNRITRDNAGRITSVGGEGATARGGRLRTAAGNRRATQTARLKSGGGWPRKPAGGSKSGPKVARVAPMGNGRDQGRAPAAQRPGSMTSTLRGMLRTLAKADARQIREIEAITGQKIAAPRSATVRQSAAARTPGRGSVSGALRDNLRQLAQSDARMVRGMADILKTAPKSSLTGSSNSERRLSPAKGGDLGKPRRRRSTR